MLKAISIMARRLYEDVYGPEQRLRLGQMLEMSDRVFERIEDEGCEEELKKAEVLVTGWGAPNLDEAFLAKAPELKLVLYAAGSIRGVSSEASWGHGVRITNSRAANAVPVSEYTLGVILLSLKHFWRYSHQYKEMRAYPRRTFIPGAYGTTVGLVSLGAVGRLVLDRLKSFDLRILAYDPYVTPEEARAMGCELVGMEELFERSDVVSLHTPHLAATGQMIKGSHFESMKEGATFVNTARGGVVNEAEMIAVLTARADLQAILDVTQPEPPRPNSPLYDLPNVVLTPHIGGATDYECRRLGQLMVDELERYVAGEPMLFEVTAELAPILA
jgi:phosphoglycerate dehydrogenase-like enzyme